MEHTPEWSFLFLAFYISKNLLYYKRLQQDSGLKVRAYMWLVVNSHQYNIGKLSSGNYCELYLITKILKITKLYELCISAHHHSLLDCHTQYPISNISSKECALLRHEKCSSEISCVSLSTYTPNDNHHPVYWPWPCILV